MQSENTLQVLKVDTWMPLDIGRFLQDTMDLSRDEIGGYILLLFQYWTKGPLPNDVSRLDKTTRVTADAPSIARALLEKYFSIGEDGLFHQRGADRRIAQWTEKRLKAKAKATHAANVRWSKHKAKQEQNIDALSIAQAMPFIGSTSTKAKAYPPIPPAAAVGRESVDGAGLAEAHPASAQAKENKERKAPQSASRNGHGLLGGKVRENHSGDVAVPLKSIAHGVKNGVRPLKTRPGGLAFKREIFAYWEAQNPDSPKCPWRDADDRALEVLRAGNVELSIEQFKELLRARAASQGINPAAPPHKWIRDLIEYASGPLDPYKHPLRASRHL